MLQSDAVPIIFTPDLPGMIFVSHDQNIAPQPNNAAPFELQPNTGVSAAGAGLHNIADVDQEQYEQVHIKYSGCTFHINMDNKNLLGRFWL